MKTIKYSTKVMLDITLDARCPCGLSNAEPQPVCHIARHVSDERWVSEWFIVVATNPIFANARLRLGKVVVFLLCMTYCVKAFTCVRALELIIVPLQYVVQEFQRDIALRIWHTLCLLFSHDPVLHGTWKERVSICSFLAYGDRGGVRRSHALRVVYRQSMLITSNLADWRSGCRNR